MLKQLKGKGDIEIFEGMVKVKSLNKKGKDFLLYLVQGMLVLASVYSTIYCFISGMNIIVIRSLLNSYMIGACIWFLILFHLKKNAHIGFLLSVILYLFAGYKNWDKIKNGFWFIENTVIKYFNEYYETNLYKYLVDDYDKVEVMTLFFIFLCILLTFVICSFILGKNSVTIFIFVTLPIVLIPIIVGRIPREIPLGIYFSCIFSTFGMVMAKVERNVGGYHTKFSNNIKKFIKSPPSKIEKKQEQILLKGFYHINLKTGAYIFCFFLALIIIIPIILSPSIYDERMNIPIAKQKVIKQMSRLDLTGIIDTVQTKNGIGMINANNGYGGLSKGKLGRIGEVKFKNETVLNLNILGGPDRLYLKGYVGSLYNGNSWSELDSETLNKYEEIEETWKNDEFPIQNQSSFFLPLINELNPEVYPDIKYYLGKIKVENLKADRNFMYAPYQAIFTKDEKIDLSNLEYVTLNKKIANYTLEYYGINEELLDFNGDDAYLNCLYYYNTLNATKGISSQERKALKDLASYEVDERAYRAFVHDAYTQIPQGSFSRLKSVLSNMNYESMKQQYGEQALKTAVKFVINYVNENTTYSLTPGVLPKGEDFVEYFLFSNQKGYCTHYASAATIVFRLLGIPARYVEGFIVKNGDIKNGVTSGSDFIQVREDGLGKKSYSWSNIHIADSNAHAWVEIYLDGFGWIPIEVTPGYSQDNGLINGTTDNSKPEQNKETKPDKELTPTPAVTADKNSNQSSIDKNPSTDGAGFYTNSARYIFYTFLLVFMMLIMCIARACIIRWSRKINMSKRDNSQNAISKYKELKNILRYYKIYLDDAEIKESGKIIEGKWSNITKEMFIAYMEVIYKAKFGANGIKNEDFALTQNFYKDLVETIYLDSSFYKKLVLKYIIII